jgi:hypothetical protein
LYQVGIEGKERDFTAPKLSRGRTILRHVFDFVDGRYLMIPTLL